MTVWDLSFTFRDLALDLMILSGLLVAATVARRYVPVLQRYLIPNNLVAGFLGLLIGPELLGWVDFSLDRMGVYVYHLLALTFIGVGLRGGRFRGSHGALQIGFINIFTLLLQALVGLGVGLVIVYLINPDFVVAVGMLLPLGFGMGPGIALSIGQSWEAYGFEGGGNIGLTISAIGFLVAYGSGMWIVNRGIRQGRAALVDDPNHLSRDVRTGLIRDGEPEVAARLTLSGAAIEPLTFHLALVGVLYLVTYVVTLGLAKALIGAGMESEVPTLWSLNFIVANLLALACRTLMDRRQVAYVLDTGFLNRITGLLADYLIAASIMAISLQIAWAYLLPVLIMCVLGGLVTYFSIRWVAPRVFRDYVFERFVGIYGEQTGTMSSGLALVRVTDPELQTPVIQDQVLGSGIALALGFPLLLLINMPLSRFGGALDGYWIAAGIMVGYLAFILLLWWRVGLQPKPTSPVSS